MIGIIPRPFRDLLLNNIYNKLNPPDWQKRLMGSLGTSGFAIEPAENMIRAVMRICFVCLAAIALYQSSISTAFAITISVIASVPCLVIAAGCSLLSIGTMMAICAISEINFVLFAIALGTLTLGYIILEKHDFKQVGILETYCINPIVERYTHNVVRFFR